jgi:4-hydroxy-2-oxoheptanedioate aldolase
MKQRINGVLQRIDNNQLVVGPVVQLASPEVVEMAGVAGFDFVWIDCEHGSLYMDQLPHMLRAADAVGVTPFVRVPDQSPSFIMRVLDAGAMGVIVPNVETADQVRAVVGAARYQSGSNGGYRGACPGTRASWHQASDWGQFMQTANDQVTVWTIIETLKAVDNIDAILEVKGLDAVVLGPFDLAQQLGYPGQVRHPKVVEIQRRIVEKAQVKGVNVVASLFSGDPVGMAEERQDWVGRGIRLFSIGSDRRVIINALRDRVVAVKGESA